MTYQQALDYIYSQLPMFHRVGAAAYKPDLGRITELCSLADNPQDRFRSIHVAGTNGKGSVSHMLASILMECGFKTGLFTSPHLKDFRERIRVNGKMIPKSKVARFVAGHIGTFRELNPSFFEMATALAFEHFRDEQVDMAVIETGMGGRLDSTNIITPVISIITNISYDHKQFLGDTLERIAYEKAGIIKPGIPAVIGETQPEIRHVFVDKAVNEQAPLVFADECFTTGEVVFRDHPSPRLRVEVIETCAGDRRTLYSPLTGTYQLKNIITVMGAVNMLRKTGVGISGRAVVKGIRKVIRNTGLQGRWQVLGKHPLIICDTGHNEGGIREVAAQIEATPHEQLHFVYGAVDDKDLSAIFPLLPRNAIYYFCRPDVPRGLDQQELAGRARAAGLNGSAYPSVTEAFAAARSAAEPGDLVFVGGSTFVVAEVI